MGRSLRNIVIALLFFVILVIFVPPFGIILTPIFMLFEASPETVAREGQPLLQALSDYRSDHGLFPEKLDDLVPVYVKKPTRHWRTWRWDYVEGSLSRSGGQPHSIVYYSLGGVNPNEWHWHGDSAYADRRVNISGPVVKPSPLRGEALFTLISDEYERRIKRHPQEMWFYGEKIKFLVASNRLDLLRGECKRDANIFPDWWLPQMALADLDASSDEAIRRFDKWLSDRGTFNNYWCLARLYRNKTNTLAAFEILTRAADAPIVKEPKDSPWEASRLLFDACQFVYENGNYNLAKKLAHAWELRGTTNGDRSWLAFEAAAELKLGEFDSSTEHAAKFADFVQHNEVLAGNADALLKAAEAHDTGFSYNPGEPEPPWELFPASIPWFHSSSY